MIENTVFLFLNRGVIWMKISYKISNWAMGSWMRAFLKDRKQKVVLEEAECSWQSVTSSVPQGSVLGPLLFVIFINDLPEGLMNRLLMYADDIKIIAESELNKDNGLQEDLS